MSLEPFWKPSKEIIEQSNIFKMMQVHGFKKYEDFWKWSVTNKEDFWKETVLNLGIKLAQKYTSILDISKGVENPEWLKNAKLNIVDSCFIFYLFGFLKIARYSFDKNSTQHSK